MTSNELRQKFLDFFAKRDHKIIPSTPLIPNDPTTLFVSAGMQPMLPYLLGEKSPFGPRVVDSQKCIRTGDIEEVGDNRHQTFFEMLGNWSFGDYFKKEQLPWIFEFLTQEAGLDPKRIYVTVFAGDEKYNLSKDTESVEIWKELFIKAGVDTKDIELGSLENAAKVGMQEGRIFYYDQKKNWWTRSASIQDMPAGEPGGPCSEMFYEFPEIEHDPKYGKHCHPNCDCGRFLEFGNSVFMQYQKQTDETLKELPNKNVDYGGGLERLTMVNNNQPDVFQTDLFLPIIKRIEELTNQKYSDHKREFRIIADHLRAATFLVADTVRPSNKMQGYVLRRLIRRATDNLLLIGGMYDDMKSLVGIIVSLYREISPQMSTREENIKDIIVEEQQQYKKIQDQARTYIFKKHPLELVKDKDKIEDITEISAEEAFVLYSTYGLSPIQIKSLGYKFNNIEFAQKTREHQKLSRTVSAGMFKGGLGEQSEIATKYHTATHLLHAALRQILGTHIQQKGSNITAERLRFDFSHTEKMTDEQLKQVEDLVNEKIKENLETTSEVMDKEKALQSGALGFFTEKYGERVTVYTIGGNSHPERAERVEGVPFSREVCGGPHTKSTGELGTLKIIKEEAVSAGIRRIRATLT